jgi:hypothetical protein
MYDGGTCAVLPWPTACRGCHRDHSWCRTRDDRETYVRAQHNEAVSDYWLQHQCCWVQLAKINRVDVDLSVERHSRQNQLVSAGERANHRPHRGLNMSSLDQFANSNYKIMIRRVFATCMCVCGLSARLTTAGREAGLTAGHAAGHTHTVWLRLEGTSQVEDIEPAGRSSVIVDITQWSCTASRLTAVPVTASRGLVGQSCACRSRQEVCHHHGGHLPPRASDIALDGACRAAASADCNSRAHAHCRH